MKRNSYPKYTTDQIHELLCQKLLSKEYRDGVFTEDVYKQACFCPYYVPLKGMALGLDWGIIVNPTSPKFGQVVFEHDGCGCANHDKQFGNQRGTSWILRKQKKTSEK
jgi:hypothetical protein